MFNKMLAFSKKVLPVIGVVSLAVVSDAFGINVPQTGSFAYDLYDVAVNGLLKGPAGFVAGVGAIVFGAANLIGGRVLTAVPSILGGAVLIKADTITRSLGMIF